MNDWNDRTKQKLDKSSEVLTKLKSKHNLTDIWRQIHPDKTSYTFIDPSSRDSNSRIDFFLCCKNLGICVTSSNITYAPTPYHKAIDIYIQLSKNRRGKGYWKMNVNMARALIRRATPFFSVTVTQQQITKAAESNLVTINRVLTCF